MPQLKSICFCLDVWYPQLGGGQDRVFNLANQLADNYQVTIVTRHLGKFSQTLSKKVTLIQLGVQAPFHQFSARFSFVFLAFKYFLSHNFDLIDFQPYSPWLVAKLIKRFKPSQRLVITALGQGQKVIGAPKMLGKLLTRLYHWLLFKSAWPLIISDTRLAIKNITLSPTAVVPNGVSQEFLTPFSVKKKLKHFVFLGRFHHQKGLDILLPAFQQLLTIHPQAKLTLIGSTENDPIKKQIRALNLSNSVTVKGQIIGPQLIKELATYTGFVLPSRFEGQAISLLLAMAAKLPIIATKVGDNQALITKSIGLLVPSEDTYSLTKAMDWILTHSSQAEAMGQAGFDKVKESYTWNKVTDKLIQAYSNL